MTEPTDIFRSPANQVILDGEPLAEKHSLPVPPNLEIIIRNPQELEHLRALLLANYPKDHTVMIYELNEAGIFESAETSLEQLNHLSDSIHPAAIRIPPLPEEQTFEYFQHIVATLRSPEGCPWDRKQTHQSLRDDFLQEAYELLDALDRLDLSMIAEELGDVLLHIVLQAHIAFENGEFKMGDVLQHISEKLIFRHEHVFAKAQKLTPDEVIDRWERMKKKERALQNSEKGLLDGISQAMPALSMAFSYQKRAARAGFDWESADGVLEKLAEEIDEFRKAESPEKRADELGDILFTLVNLSRWLKVDPETALRTANLRFRDRVSYVEKRAKALGKDLFEMPLEEKDLYWEEYKRSLLD